MDTPPTTSERTDAGTQRVVLLVASVLWLATGVSSRLQGIFTDDGWYGPYLVFWVLLMASAAIGSLAVTVTTTEPGRPSVPRIAAIALAVVATASTLVAWAFVVWAVLLAAAFAALAATGSPHRRHAGWLGGALLVGVLVAIVAVNAELGPPGTHNDYSEAQGWGVTVSCVLAGVGFAALARRTHATHSTASPAAAT